VALQPPEVFVTEDLWTIQRLRDWTCDYLQKYGSATPRLDADLLLGEVLKLPRLQLLLRLEQLVSKEELAQFKGLVKRRAAREPVAYILGKRAFHDLELRVDARVLVPRPETESLVDEVLLFLKDPAAPAGPVLDLCTGSGAIALAVAKSLKQRQQERAIVATDVSEAALAVARENAALLELEVEFLPGDLWDAMPDDRRFAVIASNPPYVLHDVIAGLEPDVRAWEPHLALDGGADGLDVLRRIAAQVAQRLVPGGLLVVELGSPAQGRAMVELLAEHGLVAGKILPVTEGPTSLVLVRAPA
jgi:release factor glutamine methyltransferase